MTPEFTAAMARATAATNASKLDEATRIIAEALGIRQAEGKPETDGAGSRLDPRAEIAEAEIIEPDAGTESASGPKPTAAPTAAPGHPLLAGLTRRIRRPLREVLRALRQGRLAAGLTRDGAPPADPLVEPPRPDLPEGARFEERRFDCAAGGRGYKLYVPAARPARGLVVMLHGCGQNPDDFALGTGMNAVAEANGLAVVYPRQGKRANISGCWNWFRPGDQRRDAGEPAIIAGMTRAVMEELGIAPDRVFVAGLSAGGAMAAVMAEAYPELYAAAGIHSGVPTGTANDVLSAFAAMRGELAPRPGAAATRARTIVFHGDADRTVHPANATRLVAVPPGSAGEAGRSAGGRSYIRSVIPAADGAAGGEVWLVEAAGHAWSGGQAAGSFTDPAGPDASAEMVRFFLEGAPESADEGQPAPST
ncbi:PHB depolymerase family esterase [uncultured Amaricoccus sp.]|uniref:extracellular catalytic domain type 1 short-chain-length polyhydroxyalkanoate depolymerase n=1 Tax=uncultured Amaricoccus sp. TaxID=339341 RepID=UPI00263150E1|nr:PHB depolymerase family esterase [uncultured Amaricoccus sp.]